MLDITTESAFYFSQIAVLSQEQPDVIVFTSGAVCDIVSYIHLRSVNTKLYLVDRLQ